MIHKYALIQVTDRKGKKIPCLFTRAGKFYLSKEIRRKRYLRSIPHDTVTEAANWIKQFTKAVLDGQNELIERSKARTAYPAIAQILSLYREAGAKQYAVDGKPAAKTVENNCGQLLNLIRKTSNIQNPALVSIDVLNKTTVEKYMTALIEQAGKDELLKQRARVTAASTLRQAKSVFTRWALSYYEDNKMLIPESLQAFLKTGKSAKRERYRIPPLELREKTFAEARKLKKQRPDLYATFLLCYDLGMRSSEAQAAQWSWFEIDADGRRSIRICRRADWKGPKNLVEHRVPLTEDTWKDLQAIRTASAHILPGAHPTDRQNLINREFARWMREIGWDKYTYPKAAHELRKLAGSMWYTKAGLEWAARWLGDTAATVDHYYADLVDNRAAVVMR